MWGIWEIYLSKTKHINIKTYSHVFFKQSAIHAKVRCIVHTVRYTVCLLENIPCRTPSQLPMRWMRRWTPFAVCTWNKSAESLRFGKTGGLTVGSNLINLMNLIKLINRSICLLGTKHDTFFWVQFSNTNFSQLCTCLGQKHVVASLLVSHI